MNSNDFPSNRQFIFVLLRAPHWRRGCFLFNFKVQATDGLQFEAVCSSEIRADGIGKCNPRLDRLVALGPSQKDPEQGGARKSVTEFLRFHAH